VNLIGDHTDYNGGFVMPVGVNRSAHVELALNTNREVQVWSAQFSGDQGPLTYQLGQERRRNDWADYVQGITYVLRLQGVHVPGFSAWIDSSVPPGSGLSSSAALEMALLSALAPKLGISTDPATLALLGQRAENEFVGAPVGIMDQLAALLATPGAVLFIDTRDLAWETIPLPSAVTLIVMDSGIRHRIAGGEFGHRRSECEQAAALLGVGQLRDVSLAEIDRIDRLPEPLRRRARHVITEDARVLAMRAALKQQDLSRCGELIRESHRSLSMDYQVSLPEIDLMVHIAERHPGVLGARLTGGGFGGAVLVLALHTQRDEIPRFISEQFYRETGRRIDPVA
jgi:galactokinase